MSLPLSVGIPTYNGARYIQAALESVLDQTFGDFDLLVSDDASDDGTGRVVADARDPRLHFVTQPQRLGLVGNWNYCVSQASGQYVYIFHQDDVMLAANVQRKLQLLDAHPNVGFVFSDIHVIDATGQVIGQHWTPCLPKTDTVFPGLAMFELLLSRGNIVPCSTVIVRRACYDTVGVFDPRLHYTPDLEMWLRLALRYDVAYVAEPLVLLRRHQGQESTGFLGQVREVDEVRRAFDITFQERRAWIPDADRLYALALQHLVNWTRMLCRESLRRGQGRRAAAFARRHVAYARALRCHQLSRLHQPAVA